MRVTVLPPTTSIAGRVELVILKDLNRADVGIPKRGMVRSTDRPIGEVIERQTKRVIAVHSRETGANHIGIRSCSNMQFDAHVFIVVVPKHIQVYDTDNRVHFSRVI